MVENDYAKMRMQMALRMRGPMDRTRAVEPVMNVVGEVRAVLQAFGAEVGVFEFVVQY